MFGVAHRPTQVLAVQLIHVLNCTRLISSLNAGLARRVYVPAHAAFLDSKRLLTAQSCSQSLWDEVLFRIHI